jgi:hypothetical protein
MGQVKGKNRLVGATKPSEFKIGQYVHIYEENSIMDVSTPLKIIGKQTKSFGNVEYVLLQIQDCNEHTEWINTIYCKLTSDRPEKQETITDVARKIFAEHNPKSTKKVKKSKISDINQESQSTAS